MNFTPIVFDRSAFAPGIYFLRHRGEIVYVGQSVHPVRRVLTHVDEGKKVFDQAEMFALAAPPITSRGLRGDLDAVEGALIRLLQPEQNGYAHPTAKTGKNWCAPGLPQDDARALAAIGWPT